jgi:hypothetical protein
VRAWAHAGTCPGAPAGCRRSQDALPYESELTRTYLACIIRAGGRRRPGGPRAAGRSDYHSGIQAAKAALRPISFSASASQGNPPSEVRRSPSTVASRAKAVDVANVEVGVADYSALSNVYPTRIGVPTYSSDACADSGEEIVACGTSTRSSTGRCGTVASSGEVIAACGWAPM